MFFVSIANSQQVWRHDSSAAWVLRLGEYASGLAECFNHNCLHAMEVNQSRAVK